MAKPSPLYNARTGKQESYDKLQELITKGEAVWRKGDAVPMVGPDGTRVDVDGDHVWHWIVNKKFSVETPEVARRADFERENGLASHVRTIAEGAFFESSPVGQIISALPKPGPDQFEEGSAGEFLAEHFEDRKFRKQANPVSSMVGEVAPSLVAPVGGGFARAGGSALGKGLASALGRAGVKETTAAAVGKGAQMASTAFIAPGEIAAQHAGRGLRALGLGNLDEAAKAAGIGSQTITEGAVKGAVRGGVDSALFGMSQEARHQMMGGKGYSVEKIASAGFTDSIWGGGIGGVLGGLGGALRKATASTKVDNFLAPGPELAALEGATGVEARFLRRLPKEQVEYAGRMVLDKPELFQKGGRFERGQNFIKDFQDTAKYINQLYQDAGKISETSAGKIMKAGLDAGGLAGGVAEAGQKSKILRRISKDYLPLITKAKNYSEAHAAIMAMEENVRKAQGRFSDSLSNGIYRDVSQAMRKELYNQIQKEAPDVFEPLMTANKHITNNKEIAEMAARASAKEDEIFRVQESGFVAGGVGLGMPTVGAIVGGARVAHRWTKTSDFELLRARAFDRLLKETDKQDSLIAAPFRTWKDHGVELATRNAPRQFAKAAPEFKRQFSAISESETQPDKTAAKIGAAVEPIAAIDRDLAAGAAKTAADDLAWMRERLPKGASIPGTTKPGEDSMAGVPTAAAASFTRAGKALRRTAEGLSRVGDKKDPPPPEMREVLAERRPEMRRNYLERVDNVELKMLQEGKKLPYDVRKQVSRLTGQPRDFSMKPAFIAKMQERYAAMKQEIGGQVAGGPQKPVREVPASMRKRAKQHQTGAEELMDKDEM